MEREQLIEFLRENLRIEVTTISEYTGGLDGSGSLYAPVTTVRLMLEGEVISEATS